MNLTYFSNCKTLDDAKSVYRQKVKELHPDLHKEVNDVFIKELNNQWDYLQDHPTVLPLIKESIRTIHNPTQYERNRIIDALYKIALSRGHKPMSIYYQYIVECNYHGIKVQQSDLEYMRTVLGYKEGWEKHQWKKYQDEL